MPLNITSSHRMTAKLTEQEQGRYSRQIMLPELGEQGQLLLKQAKVICVGAGGLGSAVLLYLAAAGIGRLGIVDGDTVSASNLQRQVLYSTSDCGRSKSEVAVEVLSALNPEVELESFDCFLTADNARRVVGGYHVLVDATDNFKSRYLLNQVAADMDIPLVHGAVAELEGRVAVFRPARGPCYACYQPKAPETAVAAGIIGAIAGITGSFQALQVLLLALESAGTPALENKLVLIDGKSFSTRQLSITKRADCPVCG